MKSEGPSPAAVTAIEKKATEAEHREKAALKEMDQLKAELATT